MKNKDGALRWGLAIFLTVSAILLFYDTLFGRRVLPAFGSQLLGALQPVIIGGVLAYLLAPVIDFIERRLFPGRLEAAHNCAAVLCAGPCAAAAAVSERDTAVFQCGELL